MYDQYIPFFEQLLHLSALTAINQVVSNMALFSIFLLTILRSLYVTPIYNRLAKAPAHIFTKAVSGKTG